MILVTGGTGLVGAHLLHHLCFAGKKVVAIFRTKESQNNTKKIFQLYQNESLFKLIEWRNADITDLPALEEAFEGITHVYHAAAMISFDSNSYAKMKKVNIEGTANIVNLSLQNNIQKLCYVSSIASLSPKAGQDFIDESCDWNPEEENSNYSITKYAGEMEVWRASQEGLKTVIVNPALIFGFGNWNVNTGKLLQQIKKGLVFYPGGSIGVVDVKDVVKAMQILMESDIDNERFILSATHISYKKLFNNLAQHLDAKKPFLKVNRSFTEIVWRINSFLHFISGGYIKTFIEKYSSRASHKHSRYVGDKIKNSISFEYTPFDQTMKEVCLKLLQS